MPYCKAPPHVLRVQERVRPRVLGNHQGVGVVRTKIDGLPQGSRDGEILEVVEMIGLIQKGKMKVKIKNPVFKAIGSRKLRQHFLPEGQCAGQLLRPPRPDAVAALGGEQWRHKTVATDQSPDGRVVTGDVRAQLRNRRLDEKFLVEPRLDHRRENRRVVAQHGHVLLKLLDTIRRSGILHPVADLVPQDAPKDDAQGCADKQLTLLPPAGSAVCAFSPLRVSEQVWPVLDGSPRPPRCQRSGVERHPLELRVCSPCHQQVLHPTAGMVEESDVHWRLHIEEAPYAPKGCRLGELDVSVAVLRRRRLAAPHEPPNQYQQPNPPPPQVCHGGISYDCLLVFLPGDGRRHRGCRPCCRCSRRRCCCWR